MQSVLQVPVCGVSIVDECLSVVCPSECEPCWASLPGIMRVWCHSPHCCTGPRWASWGCGVTDHTVAQVHVGHHGDVVLLTTLLHRSTLGIMRVWCHSPHCCTGPRWASWGCGVTHYTVAQVHVGHHGTLECFSASAVRAYTATWACTSLGSSRSTLTPGHQSRLRWDGRGVWGEEGGLKCG